MIRSRFIIFLAVLVGSIAAPAHAQLDGVSSGRHAWIEMVKTDEDREFKRVTHIPCTPADALGVAYPALTLPMNGRLLCAVDNRLLFVLEPVGMQDPATPVLTRVRETVVRRIDGPRTYIYETPAALPHIPEGFEVVDASGIGRDVVALLREQGSEEVRLYTLGRSAWEPGIGFSTTPGESLALIEFDSGPAVVRTDQDGSTLWAREASDGAVGFRRVTLSPLGEAPKATGVGGRIVVSDELGDARRVSVLPAGGGAPRTVIGFTPSDAVVLDLGGRIGAVWENESGGLMARAVSLSGLQLYDGPLAPQAVLSGDEAQVLLLVFASFVLTIVFFIWRPFEAVGAVNFPQGAVLADPSRRVTAWGVDAAVSVLAASAIWGTSPLAVSLIEPPVNGGVLPTLTALLIFIAHTSIAEAATGRSLGKALVRCRVVDRRGSSPGFGRSLLRSFIRGMCPGLGMSLLLGPVAREPWGCGTLVVSDRPGGDPSAGEESGEGTSDHPSDAGEDGRDQHDQNG